MCDTIVFVEPGRVLFAKNSDRDPNEAQVLEWHPARTHARGVEVRCTWISIPQVERTHAVLLSRPFWMWGAEIGANDHGVVIGNEAVFTRRPYAKVGLTGMDLLRLALERATTAAEAVEVLQTLLRTHGQGGGCGHEDRGFTYHNSFLVADAGGAYVVETADRECAVEHVTQGARSISNGLTIPDFARRHADPLRGRVSACALRRALTERTAGASPTVLGMMSALRSHGDSRWPRYAWLNGTLSMPCMHGGGIVASSQTTASWVAELKPGHAQHWATGTSAPCLSLFKPVSVREPVELGTTPTDHANPHTLWWAQEALHRNVMRSPEMLSALFLPERDALEQRWVAKPPPSHEAFEQGWQHLNEWSRRVRHALELKPVPDERPFWARRYWNKRERRARAHPEGGTVRSQA